MALHHGVVSQVSTLAPESYVDPPRVTSSTQNSPLQEFLFFDDSKVTVPLPLVTPLVEPLVDPVNEASTVAPLTGPPPPSRIVIVA